MEMEDTTPTTHPNNMQSTIYKRNKKYPTTHMPRWGLLLKMGFDRRGINMSQEPVKKGSC